MSPSRHILNGPRLISTTCSNPGRFTVCRAFSTSICRLKASRPKRSSSAKPRVTEQPSRHGAPYETSISVQTTTKAPQSPSSAEQPRRELIPHKQRDGALDIDRQSPVPLRVIPKAEIDHKVRLSPRERLHIEVLTRQQPQRLQTVHSVEQKVYRERLQIYHCGRVRENTLAMLRSSGIICIAANIMIVLPYHFSGSSDALTSVLIFLGGFVPAFLVHWFTQPMVTRIFLQLPLKARQSSKTAMEYAKNLPRNADLEIKYMLPYGLEGTTKAKLSDFAPVQQKFNPMNPSTWLRPVNLRRVSSAQPARFEPREFFVFPQTASGKSSKETIPGIWEGLFNQLIRSPSETSTKWKKQMAT